MMRIELEGEEFKFFVSFVTSLLKQGESLMATVDQIIAEVKAQTTQLDNLNTFVEGLQKQIKDLQLNQADQAKIDALFAAVKQNDQKIADAFTENTPAADQPKDTPTI